MTTMHRYINGYTVAVDDDGQLDRINTSYHLLDGTAATSPAVQAVLADATLTIARLQAAVGDPHEVIRLTELLAERNTTITTMVRDAERVAAEHEAWKERLTNDLHQQASDRDMCNEFDDFCENHGLNRRTQDYDVTVSVTYQSTISVSVTDNDAAREQASTIMNDDHQFPSTIYACPYSLSEQSWDIDDVEVS